MRETNRINSISKNVAAANSINKMNKEIIDSIHPNIGIIFKTVTIIITLLKSAKDKCFSPNDPVVTSMIFIPTQRKIPLISNDTTKYTNMLNTEIISFSKNNKLIF